MRRIGAGFLVLLLCVLFFGTGAYVGALAGGLNVEMDFCSDDTSARYISDSVIREQVCEDSEQ